MSMPVADSRSNRAAVQATNDDASASYFAPWAALRKLLFQFLDSEVNGDGKGYTKKQILSIGAGFDTISFQLQIHPGDAFGQQMIRNLEVSMTPTLLAKGKLFLDKGWQSAVAWDVLRAYSYFIEAQERHRIGRLELFDEFEEWRMMQEHYLVAYAINDAMGLSGNFGFPNDLQHVTNTPSATSR